MTKSSFICITYFGSTATCDSCPRGWIGTILGAASCTRCAAGRYNTNEASQEESDCTPCAVNTYSAATGAT